MTMYRAELSLRIDDAHALWSKASTAMMALPGVTMDEVIDTIGAPEAPQIEDCIFVLLDPSRFAGCAVQSIECREAAAWPVAAPLADARDAATKAKPNFLRMKDGRAPLQRQPQI